jgi:hypothetical protein
MSFPNFCQVDHLLVERRGVYFGATDEFGDVVFSFVTAGALEDKLLLNGVGRLAARAAAVRFDAVPS